MYLSPSLWAQIDDLIGYYGDSPHEVLAQVLNNWFSGHQREIAETKTRVDALKPRIEAIQKQADDEAKQRKTKRDMAESRSEDLE